jgi:predicted AlkP superfamily phosphohydrolase/phosphomutase
VLRKLASRARRAEYDTADRMVDMSRTRAWAQTLEPGTTGIWVNVVGRYPLGCVVEGPEYEALRDALVGGLSRVRDERGHPVFARVARREEMYQGPFVGEAPDVVAVCEERFGVIYESVRRDLRARTLFGPFEELGFTGTHHASGLYLFAGPVVAARGAHDEYPIESIAPTTLHLLGLPVPRAMEGPVCASIFHEEFLHQHPVRYTEEGGDEGATAAGGWKSAADEARIAEHLRALGYVE